MNFNFQEQIKLYMLQSIYKMLIHIQIKSLSIEINFYFINLMYAKNI